MTLYFDTSALIKLVVREEGSDLAADLWNSGHAAATSLLFYPEGRAALAAARRGRRLTPRGYTRSLESFEQLRLELTVVGVDEELARRAGALAADLGLRAYDAMHLASAASLGSSTTLLVTWDRNLAEAAAGLGFAVAPAA